MNLNSVHDVFFRLLRAGLWEKDVHLASFDPIDWEALYQLSADQSSVGLVSAGIEHIVDMKVTKPMVISFMKRVYSIESRNAEMNAFVGELASDIDNHHIFALLVKGQGVAQCYSRPQWRSAGDVDLLLDNDNYQRAKEYLPTLASSVNQEGSYTHHLAMQIRQWDVELHGSLRIGLSSRVDDLLDRLLGECFADGGYRTSVIGGKTVRLPSPDNDALVIFTHYLKHFYIGGIGLRQICDWCRLLWTYRETIDSDLLERRLREMGLMSEWKAFGALAVDYLGMPAESMPLYDASARWSRKARRICAFILKVGNFGQNRDMSYYSKYPYFVRKTISLGRRLGDLARHALIFPLDSFRFLPNILFHGFEAAVKEK